MGVTTANGLLPMVIRLVVSTEQPWVTAQENFAVTWLVWLLSANVDDYLAELLYMYDTMHDDVSC